MRNVFFDFVSAQNEQRLLEELFRESVEIYGEDFYYLPRKTGDYDAVLREDPTSFFDEAHLLVCYVKSVDGFQGDGNFLSKFGLEIRDQVVLSFSQLGFNEDVGSVAGIERPREGDLIFYPRNRRMFQVRFCDQKPFFYTLGTLPAYDVTCEVFEYAGERFETGIRDLDEVYEVHGHDAHDDAVLVEDQDLEVGLEDGSALVDETWETETVNPEQQNDALQDVSDGLPRFDENDPFQDGEY
jgi:hypothetical protein